MQQWRFRALARLKARWSERVSTCRSSYDFKTHQASPHCTTNNKQGVSQIEGRLTWVVLKSRHTTLVAPKEYSSEFVNGKRQRSINVQVGLHTSRCCRQRGFLGDVVRWCRLLAFEGGRVCIYLHRRGVGVRLINAPLNMIIQYVELVIVFFPLTVQRYSCTFNSNI